MIPDSKAFSQPCAFVSFFWKSMSVMAMLRQPYVATWNKSKIGHMGAPHSGQEAKEFLISKIVAEAQNQNVALSEVERKMLYFTESGWTLPDMMEVSATFDRKYDQDVYEKKIARVVAKTYQHILKSSRDEYDKWWAAIR